MPSLHPESGTRACHSAYEPLRLRSFLFVYIACALLFQLGGATPAWGPSSLIEAFCAGLFVMLAVMCLALTKRAAGLHRLFWLASGLALVALGVDEFFELHESAALGFASETDHLKVILWIGSGAALALVHWFERPSRVAQLAMAFGFLMHTLYLAVEVGDGGYYQLPLGEGVIRLAEEGLELLMLSAYLFAFGTIESETRELPETDEAHSDESEPLERAA
jgi:hypothetical protein